jgi:DNA-binding transcriptional regulator YiaG
MPSNDRPVIDAATLNDYTMIPAVARRDKPPLAVSPIRRFREEMHLSREELGMIAGVTASTVRFWEAEEGAVMPRQKPLLALIECARNNCYPLLVADIIKYVEQSQRRT